MTRVKKLRKENSSKILAQWNAGLNLLWTNQIALNKCKPVELELFRDITFSDMFGGSNDNISISSGSSAGFVMNRHAEQLLDNVFSMAGESTDSN